MSTDDQTQGLVAGSPLGVKADHLNTVLIRAERQIREMGFGVFASVPLFKPEDGIELHFGKTGGRWSLLITHGADIKAVWEAPLVQRIQAALRISALVDELRRARLRTESDLETSILVLTKYLDAIEEP